MGAFANMRFFRLSDGGVRCGADGFFVGRVPMLVRSPPRSGGGEFWTARPAEELERDLCACYGLPVDIASKHYGLAGVAQALGRGELALAKIAAVLLSFPDPPALTKDASERGSLELAAQLFWSGLLKGDWDPAKHPRTGEPPNRGWFASSDEKPQLPTEGRPNPPIEGEPKPRTEGESAPQMEGEPETEAPATGRSWRDGMKRLRGNLKMQSKMIIETGRIYLWTMSAFKDEIETSIALWEAALLRQDIVTKEIDKAVQQSRASLDPPKTLVELQTPPTQNVLGYELHHIVGQNRDNVLKTPIEVYVEKFGWNMIDAPSNLVWVPRLKHELITGYYNSKVDGDPYGRLRRQIINEGDFAAQREAGLQALRLFGVLK
jgi:hypothetical protein